MFEECIKVLMDCSNLMFKFFVGEMVVFLIRYVSLCWFLEIFLIFIVLVFFSVYVVFYEIIIVVVIVIF